tara:strand:+ start:1489 stop:1737 length:249 start_codon:yes stop_codon:yes gene_type:complete
MELNKQNLELIKELLEEKIYFQKENIFYIKQEHSLSNIQESRQALNKACNQLESCTNLLDSVLVELEAKKNCEGPFITGLHD